ncbi:hypothetical protein I549_4214 [Mycobacterium avium subsp. avium 2285 (R)]|nr:hypothetical protein I549_4214 [Mycobacterium avium subsp. avium 2285 (R)]
MLPPRPLGTGRLIDASLTALWPGSRKTDMPATPAAARGPGSTAPAARITGMAPARRRTSRRATDRSSRRSLTARW